MPRPGLLVLGPVQVHGDNGPVRLSGKLRAVLGTLLLHFNTSVSRDQLIAAVWDRPPASAVANLQTYVSQLRRSLAGVATLRTQGSRYLLPLERDQLDLAVFDDAARRARLEAVRGDLTAADREFGRAFSLCRGRPFEDAWFGSVMTPLISGVEERLAHARADWIDVRLDLGRHDDLVGELLEIVHAHPTWERAWNWYMLALYRAGRRTEALDAYHRARSALASEMGIDPGPELTGLHASILRGDPLPVSRAALEREEVASWPVIRQLPPEIGDFVGRGEELESLAGTILAGHAGAPVIAAVHGGPGVGKSALAVHLAHRLRPHFPDGQLYVRCGGSSPSPRTRGDLLAELLRALHVRETAIPASWEERAALYRSRLADRAVLLLLDDASDEEQVRALLPGTPGSAVLVTSRSRLPLEGAALLSLGVPPRDQALEFLARVAGEDRLRSDPDAADAVLRACGRLPLAIRVAGARLAARPSWPIRDLADRLKDARRRLDELSLGRLSVRADFEVSYAALPPAARRAFRLLGLTGFRRAAEWTVAALLGEQEKNADAVIETLVMAGLLVTVDAYGGRPRYAMHNLLRVYAHERAVAEDDERLRRGALRVLLAECLERVRAAVGHLPRPFAPPPPGGPVRRAPDREWPAAERENLVAAVALAAGLGWSRTAADLAYHLTSYLMAHGLHDDVARVQRTLLEAGGPREVLRARLILADVDMHRGRFDRASDEFGTLLGHFEGAGDRHASAYALTGRGICGHVLGRRQEALDDLGRAAEIFRELGDGGTLYALLRPRLRRRGVLAPPSGRAVAVQVSRVIAGTSGDVPV
ncbi:AfsR/SARP family transcriptional regulator [Sphaerisporangium album]|nr:AfsR/SARP family transcriptional regulator [Sphaerisporangium album]